MSIDKFEDYLKSKLVSEITALNGQRVLLHTNYWKFFLTTTDYYELCGFGIQDADYLTITLTDILGLERFLAERKLIPVLKKWEDLIDPLVNYVEVSPQWAI